MLLFIDVVHELISTIPVAFCHGSPRNKMRELMNDFANSRYKPCLTYLANLKPDLQLDLHLHMHLDRLYKMVEDKCLMQ